MLCATVVVIVKIRYIIVCMQDKEVHGVIRHNHINRRDDYLFRVSIKALIHGSSGKVLVVKETGRTCWDLPGGGMDHHESIKDAIRRELEEEVNLKGDFKYRIIAVEEPAVLEHARIWQMRLIFEIKPTNMSFSPGEDGDEVAFMDPLDLQNSDNSAERKVYEYSELALVANCV
jgi:ADP-ribose pyrophosphatase YjhB (NUDIX family)